MRELLRPQPGARRPGRRAGPAPRGASSRRRSTVRGDRFGLVGLHLEPRQRADDGGLPRRRLLGRLGLRRFGLRRRALAAASAFAGALERPSPPSFWRLRPWRAPSSPGGFAGGLRRRLGGRRLRPPSSRPSPSPRPSCRAGQPRGWPPWPRPACGAACLTTGGFLVGGVFAAAGLAAPWAGSSSVAAFAMAIPWERAPDCSAAAERARQVLRIPVPQRRRRRRSVAGGSGPPGSSTAASRRASSVSTSTPVRRNRFVARLPAAHHFDRGRLHPEQLGEQLDHGGVRAVVDRWRGHAQLHRVTVAAHHRGAPRARLHVHVQHDASSRSTS